MKTFNFIYNGKPYELGEENCSELINDQEHPVNGISIANILELLSQQAEEGFDMVYFDQPCPDCLAGKKDKAKYFKFLEYHFYIFTNKGEYVMASISDQFESYSKLIRKEEIDNSYIVSVIVCENCGSYFMEIEQCEV